LRRDSEISKNAGAVAPVRQRIPGVLAEREWEAFLALSPETEMGRISDGSRRRKKIVVVLKQFMFGYCVAYCK
jgi:hypothetical protein